MRDLSLSLIRGLKAIFTLQCTVASKFLILMESVRDAADLYLSLRHPPITLVCDTACTFVRHLNNREPELTNKIWGAYDGCFEIPDKTVKPRSVRISLQLNIKFFPCHPLAVLWQEKLVFYTCQ